MLTDRSLIAEQIADMDHLLQQEILNLQDMRRHLSTMAEKFAAALDGLPLSAQLAVSYHTPTSVHFMAQHQFTSTSKFSDLLPYLAKLEDLGTVASQDSNYAPLRIFTCYAVPDRATFILNLHVRLPEGGTETCKVEIITSEPTTYQPLQQVALICKA